MARGVRDEARAATQRLSESQRAVLAWLVAYPRVEIGWAGPGEHAHWTAAWASEEARQHMIGVVTDLGDRTVERMNAPRTFPHGATPRLTTRTFEALVRRGLVREIRHRPAQGVWAAMGYWQISLDGTRALHPGLVVVRGDLAVSMTTRWRSS